MKLKSTLVFFVLYLIWNVSGKISTCNSSIESYICFNVENIEDYVHTNNPEPLPTYVNISLKDIDIINVDETQQTVTLLMKVRIGKAIF